jgi:hypothetical protein
MVRKYKSRKSVRKSPRKSVRKSARKSRKSPNKSRKSARKSRKSPNKSRKSARKSRKSRKSARKSRKSRKSARKSVRKSKPIRTDLTHKAELIKVRIKHGSKTNKKSVSDIVASKRLKKYWNRPVPYPANQMCGSTVTGQDGNSYKSVPDKNGVCRWQRA